MSERTATQMIVMSDLARQLKFEALRWIFGRLSDGDTTARDSTELVFRQHVIAIAMTSAREECEPVIRELVTCASLSPSGEYEPPKAALDFIASTNNKWRLACAEALGDQP